MLSDLYLCRWREFKISACFHNAHLKVVSVIRMLYPLGKPAVEKGTFVRDYTCKSRRELAVSARKPLLVSTSRITRRRCTVEDSSKLQASRLTRNINLIYLSSRQRYPPFAVSLDRDPSILLTFDADLPAILSQWGNTGICGCHTFDS